MTRPRLTAAHRARIVAVLLLGLSLLAACGGSGDGGGETTGAVTASGPADAQTATVDGTDTLKFKPNEVDATVGTMKLTLNNTGQVPHNLVFNDTTLSAIGTVVGGRQMSQTYTFTAAGTYDFVCTFHPGMVGKVVVTPAS